jgi:hypothetical protein
MATPDQPNFGTINWDTIKRWFNMDPADDLSVWMVNLMRYKEVASYDDGRPARSGIEADDEYAPIEVLKRLGADLCYVGMVEEQIAGDPVWHRVAVVRYPSRAAFVAMQDRPDFKEKYVHKEAGMEFTIIVASLPSEVGTDQAPADHDLVVRVRPAGAPARVTAPESPMIRFVSDGLVIGDERDFGDVDFEWVPRANRSELAPTVPGEQVLVLRSSVTRLARSVEGNPFTRD